MVERKEEHHESKTKQLPAQKKDCSSGMNISRI